MSVEVSLSSPQAVQLFTPFSFGNSTAKALLLTKRPIAARRRNFFIV
jgi:hypothetical protein